MKKMYITPELMVIKINSYALLTGSIVVRGDIEAESDALSHESSFDWDDDEY